MRHCKELYDVVRIDHFRGFDEYYAIPYGSTTAEHGRWDKGPGLELFQVLKENIEDFEVIAEDLGYLTDSVLKLVKDTGFPGRFSSLPSTPAGTVSICLINMTRTVWSIPVLTITRLPWAGFRIFPITTENLSWPILTVRGRAWRNASGL